ncbi:MAG: beta-L-arabinofuranosidase domain-containing protein [Armatimonadota bacterium]
MRINRRAYTSIIISILALSTIVCAYANTDPDMAKRSITLKKQKVESFPLGQVRLTPGPWFDEQERNRRYLHNLDLDRLLYTFRKNAGFPAPSEPFKGWEAPDTEVRGHFIGHYLSACAMMYASAGDKVLKEKADAMVAEMARCQKKLGCGYLSAFPESFWDRLETMTNVPWAIYYTIHKIMAGLLDMYTLCGNERALDVLEGMASYFGNRVDKLPESQWDKVLTVEFGGMSEVLHNLYAVTGKPEHLELANKFDQPAFLGPLALEHDSLSHIHGNTQIPKVIGAARRYEVTGDERYRTISTYFWDRIAKTRTYITGGSTLWEHWPEPNSMALTLDGINHETCKTHNMLKLTRHLFEWTADPGYADFYERGLLNGIIGTQGAEPGELSYYIAMGTGYPRTFGAPEESFWCCYGTGIESFSKLGDSIYFHDKDSLYVNLLVPSTVEWADKGVRLEQKTQFPTEDTTSLAIRTAQPSRFALMIRIPYWATNGVELRINGKLKKTDAKPSSYLRIKREWEDGDTIDLHLPMSLHLHPIQDDDTLMAVMYGPLVMAGVVGKLEPGESQVHASHDGIFGFQISPPVSYFTGDPAKPESWIHGIPGKPLTFKTAGQRTDIEFIPFNQVTNERYGIYWPVVREGVEASRRLELSAQRRDRQIDCVFPHNAKSEKEHNQQGEKTESGLVTFLSKSYRHAQPGGWFSWDLKAVPDAPMSLLCTYWGSDAGRTFDILVDGTVIATQEFKAESPGAFVDVEYSIPAALTSGKNIMTVSFKPHGDSWAGGIFYCASLKAAEGKPD